MAAKVPTTNQGPGTGTRAVRNLFNGRKIYSTPYVPGQPININLGQYLKDEYVRKFVVRVKGNFNLTATGSAATGLDNPEGLLTVATVQSQPVVNGIVPFNAVSGRAIKFDSAFERGYFLGTAQQTPFTDSATGIQAIDAAWEFLFKRPRRARKSVEYDFPFPGFNSATMTLNFGDINTLFTGATGSWAAVVVEVWCFSDYNIQSDRIQSHELFEQLYTVSAANSQFLLNQMTPGYVYTDLCLIAEVANVPTDGVIDNIDLESSGNIWFPAGDDNARIFKEEITVPMFSADSYASLAGVYALPMWDGMFSRSPNFVNQPPLFKINVLSACNIRVIGRRQIPGGLKGGAAGAQTN